jgi:hypothetical protein
MYFRKRIKIMPGVSVNLSKSGASYSFGPKGYKLNVSKHGVHRTASANILGWSVSDRKKIAGFKQSEEQPEQEIGAATVRQAIDYCTVWSNTFAIIGMCFIAGAFVLPWHILLGAIGLALCWRAGHYSQSKAKFLRHYRELLEQQETSHEVPAGQSLAG